MRVGADQKKLVNFSMILNKPFQRMSSSEDKWPGEVVRISYQETEAGLRLGDTQESLTTGPLLIFSRGDLKEKVDSCK